MSIENLAVLAYLSGGVISVLYPYLIAYLNKNEAFDFRKAGGRIIGVLFSGLVLFATPGFLEGLVGLAEQYDYPALYFIAVMLIPIATGDLASDTVKIKTNKGE